MPPADYIDAVAQDRAIFAGCAVLLTFPTEMISTCGVRWQAREAFRASRSAPRLTRSYCMRASGVQSMRRRRDDRAVRVDADLVWLHGFRRWRRQVGHLPAAHVPH